MSEKVLDLNSKSALAEVGVIASNGGIRVANPKKIVEDGARAMYRIFQQALEIQAKRESESGAAAT